MNDKVDAYIELLIERVNEKDVSSAGDFNSMHKALADTGMTDVQVYANKLVRNCYGRKEGKSGSNPHTIASLKSKLAMTMFSLKAKRKTKEEAEEIYNKTVRELNKRLR